MKLGHHSQSVGLISVFPASLHFFFSYRLLSSINTKFTKESDGERERKGMNHMKRDQK